MFSSFRKLLEQLPIKLALNFISVIDTSVISYSLKFKFSLLSVLKYCVWGVLNVLSINPYLRTHYVDSSTLALILELDFSLSLNVTDLYEI